MSLISLISSIKNVILIKSEIFLLESFILLPSDSSFAGNFAWQFFNRIGSLFYCTFFQFFWLITRFFHKHDFTIFLSGNPLKSACEVSLQGDCKPRVQKNSGFDFWCGVGDISERKKRYKLDNPLNEDWKVYVVI